MAPTPTAKETAVQITVQSSSMRYSDTAPAMAWDCNLLFGRGSHIVGGTEASQNNPLWHLIPKIGADHGYHVVHQQNGEWLAVAKDFAPIVDNGYLPISPGQPGPASQGGHQPRGLLWVEIEHPMLGTITPAWGHWITGYNNRASRAAEHTHMTKVFTEFVNARGKGKAISVFGGDININEETDLGKDHGKPDWLFNEAGMTTIWDALYKHGDNLPSTHNTRHGATIDIIGALDKDQRVSAVDVQVFLGSPLRKDHADVVATYEVKPLHVH